MVILTLKTALTVTFPFSSGVFSMPPKVTFGGIENTPDENGNVTVNAVLSVNITIESGTATMDKTYREILAAYTGGRFVCFHWIGDDYYSSLWAMGPNSGHFTIWENSGVEFDTETEDGYPSARMY